MRKLSTLLFLLTFALVAQADSWRDKINDDVYAQLETGALEEVIIYFAEQADLSRAATIRGKAAKGQYVYQQVQQLAQRTQVEALAILEESGNTYRSFAIVNAIYAQVNLSTARQLAELAAVKNIQPNPWTQFDQPTPDRSLDNSRNVIEWGLEKINANDVWGMGFQGEGIVIGGQDTGYEWYHPTIQEQYRGWDGTDADHNYHWHDAIHSINPLHNDSIPAAENNPCGLDSPVPCDDHNHGTHTMGTMVGDDGQGNQIGVAPEATWIGCRNMDRGWGSPASYIECFNWFLAPTDLNDENPDPAMAPHVIANSWGCPPVEGCEPENFQLMETAVNALRAAGVVVVVSGGNSGPNCNSVDDPAAIFEGSFSVGASRSTDTIANFSSRGAVSVDGSLRLKPNVVAPGVGIRSAVRGGGYATWNGTSMAGPHVAGAVALLINAAPQLEGDVEAIETLLEETARPMLSEQDCNDFLGMATPNATYGFGRIDVLAAVEAALTVDTENTLEGQLQLFPNPAQDRFVITGWIGDEALQLSLFNAQGQLVRKHTVINSLEEISVVDLPAGNYWYELTGTNLVQRGKLVVQ